MPVHSQGQVKESCAEDCGSGCDRSRIECVCMHWEVGVATWRRHQVGWRKYPLLTQLDIPTYLGTSNVAIVSPSFAQPTGGVLQADMFDSASRGGSIHITNEFVM